MAQQNQKDTKTGGKEFPGHAPMDEDMKAKVGDEYREGTSGSPDDQGGVSPFGTSHG